MKKLLLCLACGLLVSSAVLAEDAAPAATTPAVDTAQVQPAPAAKDQAAPVVEKKAKKHHVKKHDKKAAKKDAKEATPAKDAQ